MDIQLQPNRDDLPPQRVDFNPDFGLPRPRDTRVAVIDRPDGVTILIPPPLATWRLKAAVVVGGLLSITGLAALVGLFSYFAMGNGRRMGGAAEVLPLFILLPLYTLPVGLAVTFRTLSFLRWRIELSISGDQLRLRRSWALGEVRQAWPKEAIAGVYVTGGDRLTTLSIEMHDGPPVKVPNYNGPVPYPTTEEWEWIAALLHGYLNPRSPIEAQTARPKPEPPDGITPGETGVARP